jgi:hypothetical protein
MKALGWIPVSDLGSPPTPPSGVFITKVASVAAKLE